MRGDRAARDLRLAIPLKKTIAVLSALRRETRGLRCRLRPSDAAAPDGTLTVGRLGECEVILGQSGVGPSRAAQLAERVLRQHSVEAVLSVGFAGALSPQLAIGELVLAERVRYRTPVACDPELMTRARRVVQTLALPYRAGLLISREALAGTLREKQGLFLHEGPVALDMESGAVAEVVSKSGLPFLAVRSISDRFDQSLDPWLAELVGPEGSVRFARLLWGLLSRPPRIGSLLCLGRQTALASGTLNRFLIGFLSTF